MSSCSMRGEREVSAVQALREETAAARTWGWGRGEGAQGGKIWSQKGERKD